MLDSGQPRLWRLSTVHRVEELKSIIRLIPIWSTGILLVTAGSHIHTFTLQQVRSLDRHLSPKFQIPPASFSVFAIIAKLLSLAFYDRIFVPVARRFTGNPSGITYLQRMGIGLAIAMTANVPAALIETKRKQIAAEHGLLDRPTAPVPMTAFWLLPQYAIHGVGDAFMSVGHMEFLYDQVPESMRSMAAALFSLSSSIGNYLGTLLVTVVHLRTKGKGDWLQDNINRGKLDCYHWLMTAILVVNFFYYIICAKYYTPKQLMEVTKNPSKVMVEESVAGKVLELT